MKNNLLKLTIISTISLAAFPATATNYYLGGQVSFNKLGGTNNTAVDGISLYESDVRSDFGGGIFGGAKFDNSRAFSHAIEGGIEMDKAHSTKKLISSQTEVRVERAYNLSVAYLPTYQINKKFDAFGLAGVDYAQFKYIQKEYARARNQKTTAIPGASIGAGINYNMENWSVGLLLKHTWYKGKSIHIADGDGALFTTKSKPRVSQASLRFKIPF